MQKIILVLFTGFLLSNYSFAQTNINSQATQEKPGILVKAGQKFIVESSTIITNAVEMMGQTMEMNANTKNTTKYEVVSVGTEAIGLQKTITKLTATASMMGQEMNYDSDKQDNPDMTKELFGNMVNKPESILIDNKGKINKQAEVSAPSNPLSAMSGIPENETSTDLFIPELAGKELKAGDSISSTSESKTEKQLKKESGTYKVTAIDNGVASISYSGTEQITAEGEQMGMKTNNVSNNVVKTELQMDYKTGLVLVKATVTETNTKTTIEGMGSMEIPSTGKIVSTITVKPQQ